MPYFDGGGRAVSNISILSSTGSIAARLGPFFGDCIAWTGRDIFAPFSD